MELKDETGVKLVFTSRQITDHSIVSVAKGKEFYFLNMVREDGEVTRLRLTPKAMDALVEIYHALNQPSRNAA